jgi:AcrR family transcriptional regulator
MSKPDRRKASKKRKNSKEDIIESAIWLVAREGMQAATIRAIARRAGITEGAIYRHFTSKIELLQEIYERLVAKMAEDKKRIAGNTDPFGEKLHEWIRITYEFYDEYPEAFTFVLLTPHNLDMEVFHKQGKIFIRMVQAAQRTGEARKIKAPLALSHFTGVTLNVTRLINEGTLRGPAIQYVEEVSGAVHRMCLKT